MNIAYARVSTGEQTLDLQLDALERDGCEKTFTETASGAKNDRPLLQEALAYARPATPSSSGAWTGSAAPCPS